MRAHSVHTEPNECDFLATPNECCVGVALFLTATVDGSRHVGKQMRSSVAHEADAVAELMPNRDHLKFGQVKVSAGSLWRSINFIRRMDSAS